MTAKENVPSGILRRFARDERGVGAIEFAILFPVLLMLYLGAFELTVGLSASKRASRSAGSIADIVSQQSSITKSVLATMPSVAGAIFAPYGTTGLTLKITGIAIDASGKATVAWSWAQDGSRAYTVGSTVTLPANMNQASTFLVRSELTHPYQLLSFGANFLPSGTNQITISRQYYYRQRVGTSISCSDC
ncbi:MULTISPECIES: TadE/TadG family type IV pilus assembly protein [Rhizobium]|uniref:Pilus assembly protein n=1 Tax=Rhizobium tropici TaxID=398 RepID=A0A6P1C826_RHITR|nr:MULTISPECIES: TadE/TadG family type IV pilus assembly protein [Rhizobium]MBB4244063.1 Flp pilus assembly protein TadG [Rhizobium tropici]MBB5595100.1 Flp pilus assembly protein TadG [Rhizobium tropici]MBB6494402.1 Flp pilus assembly protein TadG [Rhizobium tropici]NEV12546.1 pilus assembly protein [Rhizobium tropici]TGF00351.1 pilus assembly protein [Rhizobium sp. SEMIA 4088]